MKTKIDDKLERIADIWNYFILPHKFCSSKIKFNNDVKTNYFGDILGYFKDTMDIVFSDKKHSNYTDKFSFTISFLQAIYIHQDFMQELLEMFKTNIEKGALKLDPLYFVNRDIRNELVGHPIRKFKGNLISSTLFSYEASEQEIQYLRYHKDNDFKFELKNFKILEIQESHQVFLEKYFDVILVKLKTILDDYLIEIDKVQNVIEKGDFKIVLTLVELYFEAIFESDFIYDKASLIKIHDRKDEHIRYKNFIEKFNNDLKTSIIEKRDSLKNIFERQSVDYASFENTPLPSFEEIIPTLGNTKKDKVPPKETYHYELGKLATKRNRDDFMFFGGLLKSKLQDNNVILIEIEHMDVNIHDEIEYYTALNLINTLLNQET